MSHPVEDLTEALVAYVKASGIWSPYYVGFYLCAVLRQLIESLPDDLRQQARDDIMTLIENTENRTGSGL
jgi:hypothetical protein